MMSIWNLRQKQSRMFVQLIRVHFHLVIELDTQFSHLSLQASQYDKGIVGWKRCAHLYLLSLLHRSIFDHTIRNHHLSHRIESALISKMYFSGILVGKSFKRFYFRILNFISSFISNISIDFSFNRTFVKCHNILNDKFDR